MTRSDERRDELLAELERGLEPAVRARIRARGLVPLRVAGVSGDDVIVEVGPREQGVVPLAEFDAAPAVGSALEGRLRGREDGLWSFSVREARTLAAWDEVRVGALVSAKVVGINKGGLECKVGGLPAFLPASQVALHRVEDLTSFGGQTLVCEVLEMDPGRKRLVLSRRAVLEAEREQSREEVLGALTPGTVLRGKVTRLESYGAFVQVGQGLEGLLHVSQIAHRRLERPDEELAVGDDIEVVVLAVEENGKRVSLGRKQLTADPWREAADRLRVDQVLNGTVRRLMDFGAFVELEPGVEGLLHVSQMDAGRVRSPRDVVRPGQELPVRILSIDPTARRISLSRLDPRGAVLGSEESVASADVEATLERSSHTPTGTNLGALFQKALRKKQGS